MSKNKKIIIGIIVASIVMLCWSPWLNNQKLHDKVLEEGGRRDGTIDKYGNLVCDYKVTWFPFGRWVGSCEGAYYVTFWGKILPPVSITPQSQKGQIVEEIMPKFEDYPVEEIFQGVPVPIDLASAPKVTIASPGAVADFETRLIESAKQGPNFAGHYTVVEWGCGTACQNHMIVDAITGKVYSLPEPSDFTTVRNLITARGLSFRLDSNLLIADPPCLCESPQCLAAACQIPARFYLMEEDGLRLIYISKRETVITYLEKNILKPSFGGVIYCNYEFLGEQHNSGIHYYVWALCQEYYLKGGRISEGSGVSLPAALTLRRENDTYKVINHEIPEDGSFYRGSIERIFPKNIRQNKMFSNDVNYHNQHIRILEDKIKKKAEFYFNNP
jgi:hypothetical protein